MRLLQVIRGFSGTGSLSIAMISGPRCMVDAMDEKPDDILNLSLVPQIKLRPRIGLFHDTDPHGQPFRKSEHVFVRLIVTDEEQSSLSKVTHQRQDRRSFPALPRRKRIHRRFADNEVRRRG